MTINFILFYIVDSIDKSNSFKMELPEILIIAFIIFLWLLTIRKFIKQFERIRTTHYREIPYSYRTKKMNDNKIIIAKHETDSIIHAIPFKTTRSKSLPSDQYKDKNKANPSSVNSSPEKNRDEICGNNFQRKSISSHQLFNTNDSIGMKNSDSLSPIIIKFDSSPKKIGSMKFSTNAFNDNYSKPSFVYVKNETRDLINPFLIPPIVRRSLLDLHRRSAEHITIQMIQKDCKLNNDRAEKDDVFIESHV